MGWITWSSQSLFGQSRGDKDSCICRAFSMLSRDPPCIDIMQNGQLANHNMYEHTRSLKYPICSLIPVTPEAVNRDWRQYPASTPANQQLSHQSSGPDWPYTVYRIYHFPFSTSPSATLSSMLQNGFPQPATSSSGNGSVAFICDYYAVKEVGCERYDCK